MKTVEEDVGGSGVHAGEAVHRPIKRAFDVLVSLVVLVAGLPLLLLVAVAIKLEDGGSVFYVQERLGQGGSTFPLLKFRSMVEGADRMEGGYRIREGDERITRVGQVLRRFSLDELPQLVNVLRGEMSLVGPRPALLRDLDRYSERQRGRLRVRPGISGLAQVSGRASISWDERIDYDLDYIENWSFWLDLKILGRTVVSLFRRHEVYAAADPWSDRPEDEDLPTDGFTQGGREEDIG